MTSSQGDLVRFTLSNPKIISILRDHSKHKKFNASLWYIYICNICMQYITVPSYNLERVIRDVCSNTPEHFYLYLKVFYSTERQRYFIGRSNILRHLGWETQCFVEYLANINEFNHLNSLFNIFETSHKTKGLMLRFEKHCVEQKQEYLKYANQITNLFDLHKDIIKNVRGDTVIFRLSDNLISRLNNIVGNKFVEFIKTHKVFMFGSGVLSLLHEKDFAKDIDLSCSIDDREEVIRALGKISYNFTECTVVYGIEYKLYEGYNDIIRKKIQLSVINKPYREMFLNFNKMIDICQTGTIIFSHNDKLCIKGTSSMASTTFDLNLDYFNKVIDTKHGIINLHKTHMRCDKYITRGFQIRQFGNINLDRNLCSICCNSGSYAFEQLYKTRCGHIFHLSCINAWINYNPGERIIIAKSSCPDCRERFRGHFEHDHTGENLNYVDISRYDFTTQIPIKCVSCSLIFISDDQPGGCAVDDAHLVVTCHHCLDAMGIGRGIVGSQFECPNCSMVLEHAGGCAEFTCCRYGNDYCQGGYCDVRTTDDDPIERARHGSTNSVRFCGHRWTIR